MARIKLISDRSEVEGQQAEDFDAVSAMFGSVGGPFSLLIHSPGLAPKVMEMGAQIRLHSELEPVERELAVIATSREKDAQWEWNSHTRAGRNAGLSEATIDVVRAKGDVSKLAPDEADIVNFVRQLLRTNRVSQELFDRLVEEHSERWVVELAATVGQYQYIAAINNTFELIPGPDADPLPVPAESE